MNDLYTWPVNDYRFYCLAHHGVRGQRWGVRNADWYPISAWKAHLADIGNTASKVTNAVKNAGRSIAERANSTAKSIGDRAVSAQKEREKLRAEAAAERERELSKAKRVQAREEAAAKARETKERKKQQEQLEADRQRKLASGTMDEILGLEGVVDNKQLYDALNNRKMLDQKIKDINYDRSREKIDKAIKDTARVAELAGNAYNLANKGYSLYKETNKILKDLGLIDDATPVSKVNLKGENLDEVRSNVYKAMFEGKITPADISKYEKYLKSAESIRGNIDRDKKNKSNNSGEKQQENEKSNNKSSIEKSSEKSEDVSKKEETKKSNNKSSIEKSSEKSEDVSKKEETKSSNSTKESKTSSEVKSTEEKTSQNTTSANSSAESASKAAKLISSKLDKKWAKDSINSLDQKIDGVNSALNYLYSIPESKRSSETQKEIENNYKWVKELYELRDKKLDELHNMK